MVCWEGLDASSLICRISGRVTTRSSGRCTCASSACSDRGIPVLVCDRPNPINGVTIEERYPILPTGPLSDFIRYRFDMEKRSENQRSNFETKLFRNANWRYCRWKVGNVPCGSTKRAVVGAPVSEYADARNGNSLCRHVPAGSNQHLGGSWHQSSVRAFRCSVDFAARNLPPR